MNFSLDKKFLLFLFFCFFIYFQGIFDLPVMDRDEARFVTASKTMLIEKEYIDIKMVDETRYKKPIGIYWAQVFSNKLLGSYPFTEIWIYRLPSVLGFFFSMIFFYFYFKQIETPIVVFTSVFFLTISLLTISEIHQSKTDALLFLFITICNLILYKTLKFNKINKLEIYIFWICIALGILTKGPIIIIFTLIPLLLFSVIKKRNLFGLVWSLVPFLICLLISIPWFVLINIKSEGIFWHESIGNDLFNKIKSGQESHGFPPGYYSILIFIFFWPASIFFLNFLKDIKSKFSNIFKTNDYKLFLMISFLLPFFIFELIPTKLPHYVYPSYLPLSILISKFIMDKNFDELELNSSIISLILYPVVITGLIFYAVYEYHIIDTTLILVIIFNISFIILLLVLRLKKNIKKVMVFSGLYQLSIYLTLVFFLIPRMEKLWISQKIENIINENEKKFDHVFTLGFNEPSLLFLTSHLSLNDVSFNDLTSEDINNKNILFIMTPVNSRKMESRIKFKNFNLVEEFHGFNYSKGKEIKFQIYQN